MPRTGQGLRCERRRTIRHRHDRGRGRHRGPGDPGLLRHRIRIRPTLPLALDSMLAVFGINNDGVNLAVNLLILFLVVIWFALIYWTNADARRRIGDPMLVGCATAASLFPFV